MRFVVCPEHKKLWSTSSQTVGMNFKVFMWTMAASLHYKVNGSKSTLSKLIPIPGQDEIEAALETVAI